MPAIQVWCEQVRRKEARCRNCLDVVHGVGVVVHGVHQDAEVRIQIDSAAIWIRKCRQAAGAHTSLTYLDMSVYRFRFWSEAQVASDDV